MFSAANSMAATSSTVVLIQDMSNENIRLSSNLSRLRRSAMVNADESFLTPWQKLKLSYQGRYIDPKVKAMSDRAGTALFWYMALSELYIYIAYFVPLVLSDYGETARYYATVACWFGFIQTTANWACIRYVRTDYQFDESQRNEQFFVCSEENQSLSSGFKTESNAAILKWQWCDSCLHYRPPRCHHCIICNRCILKRDHHCYITGRCIGFANQRYFVIMNFYIAIFSLTLFFYEIRYLSNHFAPRETLGDYFLPVTVYKALFDHLELHQLVMVSHMYTAWWIGASSAMFFVWHIGITAYGITSHEFLKRVKVRSTSSLTDNFRSVFGPMWMFNFVMPAQIVFRQHGDGMNWTNLKPT